MSSSFQSPVYVTINDETKSLRRWAKDSGLPVGTVYSRYRNGIRGEALIEPNKYTGIRNDDKRSALKDLWHGRWVYVRT